MLVDEDDELLDDEELLELDDESLLVVDDDVDESPFVSAFVSVLVVEEPLSLLSASFVEPKVPAERLSVL